MNDESKKATKEAKEIREPETVCWAFQFAGFEKPLIDLAERTKEELEQNLADEPGSFTCLPLIVKPD